MKHSDTGKHVNSRLEEKENTTLLRKVSTGMLQRTTGHKHHGWRDDKIKTNKNKYVEHRQDLEQTLLRWCQETLCHATRRNVINERTLNRTMQSPHQNPPQIKTGNV